MTPLMDDYLRNTVSPEVYTMFDEVFMAFDKIGFDKSDLEYDQLLMTGDDVDTNELVATIISMTRGFIDQILAEHNVYLTDEATLSDGAVIINALLDINDVECKADVVACIDSDDNSEERFCELVALVSGKTIEELLPIVESVGIALIVKIREDASRIVTEEDLLDDIEQIKHIEAVRLFVSTSNLTSLKVLDAIRNGLPIGLPFSTYADIYSDVISKMQPKIAAAELFCIGLISDGYLQPSQVVKENLEKYFQDPSFITKVDIEVMQYLLAYQNNSGLRKEGAPT